MSWLILGGVGFIGRHLVCGLVKQGVDPKEIRVVDKAIPATSFFTVEELEVFSKIEYIQGNLANPAVMEKAFNRTVDDGKSFDYVVNLAAETKYGQTDEIYEERVFKISSLAASEAAKRNVSLFMEFSTAQVYDGDKKSSSETSKLKPWTNIAKYKAKAEDAVIQTPKLNWVIFRPAIVYGPSDTSGITPRLIIGAVYQELKEEMKLLWSGDLRINTVHVRDVVQAVICVAKKGLSGQIFNLADKGDTDQETINKIIEELFKIKTGFFGSIISNLARLNFSAAVEESNEKHMQPWSELCKKSNCQMVLSPYLDQEVLLNNSLCVDGSKIEQTIGFTYTYPKIEASLLREVLDHFIDLQMFPKKCLE